jgi:hypothetical protein
VDEALGIIAPVAMGVPVVAVVVAVVLVTI